MKFKKYAMYLGAITLAMGIATGCQSNSASTSSMASSSTDEQVVLNLINDAKSALSDAKKGNYAWRDTGKLIKKAEDALADGNNKKASTLAAKALEQSQLAKKQSIEQDSAVKQRFN